MAAFSSTSIKNESNLKFDDIRAIIEKSDPKEWIFNKTAPGGNLHESYRLGKEGSDQIHIWKSVGWTGEVTFYGVSVNDIKVRASSEGSGQGINVEARNELILSHARETGIQSKQLFDTIHSRIGQKKVTEHSHVNLLNESFSSN